MWRRADGAAAAARAGSPARARRGPRRAWDAFARAVRAVNGLAALAGGMLIVVSCLAISNEVVWRYFLRHPHTWSLEFNVFLLIGATFLCAGYTQQRRGHVGTEVLQTLMPPRWNRRRIVAGDTLSALLCALLTVRVAAYAFTAWSQGWTTDSVWAPPLWIPYALIALGMALLTLEFAVQLGEEAARADAREESRHDAR